MAEPHQIGVTGQILGYGVNLTAGASHFWTVTPWDYGEVSWAAAFPTDRQAELEVSNLGYVLPDPGGTAITLQVHNKGPADSTIYALYIAWTDAIPRW